MKLVSVNVGLPKEISHEGKIVRTGIDKKPVPGRIPLHRLGLEGDGQGNRDVHGGAHKAACVYPAEHYRHWEAILGRSLPFGFFGENFTVEGLLEDEIRIGDVFRIGNAIVEVTQPRFPCFKLGIRTGSEEFPDRFMKSGRTGFYLRVVTAGDVGAGDEFQVIRRGPTEKTVRDKWEEKLK
jgi:MOSC domain-containing protein YiiM